MADLSREVLQIDIESPIFSEMLSNVDTEIQRVISKVFNKEFEGGEITLKISIELQQGREKIQRQAEDGELYEDEFLYRKPYIKHNVSTTLKKKFKKEGLYTSDRDVEFNGDKYIAIPIQKAQMSFFEEK